MITRIKGTKSLSSSSAFIIIIVLIVVSVAAIVVGGGDGFSRKYAGIDLREFSGRMLLAQTGVIGKILRFEEENGQYNLSLLPIELDGSLLSGNERYVSSVVPPREGDTPFSYRPEEGIRVTQGYPIKRSYVDQYNLTAFDFEEGQGLNALQNQPLPNIPGTEVCNQGSMNGYFDVFYEDVAYDTGVGFDDPEKGFSRRTQVCDVLQEFEEMLLLDQLGLKPGIVMQASTEKTPDLSLSVVSPQYVGGSGFVSTLLADYLRSGIKRSQTSFSDTVSVLGINSGFMRFNFGEGVVWSVDTGNSSDFDLKTVTRQNMLRLLGFGSFLGHEQENILSSSWKRWTEWDRLLFDVDYESLINPINLSFNGFEIDYEDFNPGNPENYSSKLLTNGGGINLTGIRIPDNLDISFSQSNSYPIFTSSSFQKGQSITGLNDEEAVSYPILEKGEIKTVTQAEKEILCMLGIGVVGVNGCGEGPRAVAQDVYIERQNNRTVCVNINRGLYSSAASNFILDGEITEMTGNVDVSNSEQFRIYRQPCPDASFASEEERQDFASQYTTTDLHLAKSFSWTPSQSESLYREYVQFSYAVKDTVTRRRTDERVVAIHKCVVPIDGNQLCNGDFQFSGATSPVDYKLSPLQAVEIDGTTIVTCQSTTMPGWCAQGVQDGFSSEFGYTWHPYLISNPEAFDAQIVSSPRRYAGGSSGAIVQRLRRPLEMNTQYLVTGKVYVTQSGLKPTFWYGAQEAVLEQPDGTYHVDYPEALAEGGRVIDEYVLTQPLTTGEWHSFSWTLDSGNDLITHIAFGGSNNNGFILYDDLSVQAVQGCGNCLTDLDGDCVTNIDDLSELINAYAGECPNESVGCTGDITFDGVVDTRDLLQFISQYGRSCFVEEEPDEEDNQIEICTDGIDNDGDGYIDKDDRDCALDQNCEFAGTCEQGVLCSDKKDNDGDGLVDLKDSDCQIDSEENTDDMEYTCIATGTCQTEALCNDGEDNDGDGRIDMRDPECADGCGYADIHCIDEDIILDRDRNDRGTSSSDLTLDSEKNVVFIDDNGIVDDIYMRTILLEGEEIVPNAGGFRSNYYVSVVNPTRRNINDLNMVGALPSMFSYNGHVATERGVGYDKNTNTIAIPTLRRNDSVQVYFSVDLTPNTCAQLQQEVSITSYNKLVDLDLCNRYKEIVDASQSGTSGRRGGASNISSTPGGGGITLTSSTCTDGIDNDGDGFIDTADKKCVDTHGVSEFGVNDCSDGIDNDGDGLIDLLDPECKYSQGTSESSNQIPECSDGIDNDGDGVKDANDPDCQLTEWLSEGESQQDDEEIFQCNDGEDNDGDGFIDLDDPDCSASKDDDESSKGDKP